MEKLNADNKRKLKTDLEQTSSNSVIGWAKRNLLNLPDGGITAKQKTARMLLPVAAIFLVFVLVRVFNVSSPESAVSQPTSLVEQTAEDVNKTDINEPFQWLIPEMFPNTLSTDLK
ncbi:MAG TPA: hypothetical protein PLP05_07600 [Sedimentisphaerales bacterium]|nr:hypothetical protein [Sedimentisphaerales bacterium]